MRKILIYGLALSTLMSLGSVCFASTGGENTTESSDMSTDFFFDADPNSLIAEIANECAEMRSFAKSLLANIESEISELETEISELEARMDNEEILIAATEVSLAELKARLAVRKDMKTTLEIRVALTEHITGIL